MRAELTCFEPKCRARYPLAEVIYNCPKCGGLLEVTYAGKLPYADEIKRTWRERRTRRTAPCES